jgi:hypothetical protein
MEYSLFLGTHMMALEGFICYVVISFTVLHFFKGGEGRGS